MPVEQLVEEPFAADDDPLIAPLMREQLEPLLGGRRDGGVGTGERALMRAILQDAVLCLFGEAAPANERARLIADARYWIELRSREWIFSFENVCDALGFDPSYVRRHLLRMADARRAAASPGADHAEPAPPAPCAVRGLRRSGGRARRAIHFAGPRRRRRAAATGTAHDDAPEQRSAEVRRCGGAEVRTC